MLAIVSKESSFIPKDEASYATTSNARIRAIFGSRVANLTEDQLTNLKKSKTNFFNLVYSTTAGNQGGNDGSKYIGRGYNQLTGKANYKAFGDSIGVDLVKNPEKVNDPEIAAKVLVAYNKKGMETLKRVGKLSAYNSTGINDFKNTTDATLAFYHITAGSGKSVAYVRGLMTRDPLGGMTRALARVNDLFSNIADATVDYVKKNP
jgi:hypothetical protein